MEDDKIYTKVPRRRSLGDSYHPGLSCVTARGKDVMLGDIEYRIKNRNYGEDLFKDKEWIEARIDEVNRHPDGSSYSKSSGTVTKEKLLIKLQGMLEDVDAKIYAHTMPTYALEGILELLKIGTITEKAKKDTEKKLKEVFEYLKSEEAPDIYYTRPVYDRRNDAFERGVETKDQVIAFAFEMAAALKTRRVIKEELPLGDEE